MDDVANINRTPQEDEHFLMKIFGSAKEVIADDDFSMSIYLTGGVRLGAPRIYHGSVSELEDNMQRRLDQDENRRRFFDIFAQNGSLRQKWEVLISNLIPENIKNLDKLIELNRLYLDLNVFRKTDLIFYVAEYINANPRRQMIYADKILTALANVEDIRNRDQIYRRIVSNETNVPIIQTFVKKILYHQRMVKYTMNKIDTIFPLSAEIEDCLWAERKGIFLSCFLDILTPTMAASFIKILEGVHPSFKEYYADGVVSDLIQGILFKLRNNALPAVDKVGFLKILVRFMEYRISLEEDNEENTCPISNQHLETSLNFVNAGLSKESVEFFFETAEYLLVLDRAGFGLSPRGDDIVVFDPRIDFNFVVTTSAPLGEMIEIRRKYRHIHRDGFFQMHIARLERMYLGIDVPELCDEEAW